MGRFELLCLEGGEHIEDDYTLMCGNGHKGLLRTVYEKKQLTVRPCRSVFKFYDWLPVHNIIETVSSPTVFQNPKLSKELGLKNLWVGFTGYYPERDTRCMSCSFKEMEALPTYARLKDCGKNAVVVASAGNTARAFAQVAEEINSKCIVIVPEGSEKNIITSKSNGNARLYTVKGDYADSIQVADRVATLTNTASEGGARNIARRDGMGTVMLEGAVTMGRIPDYYFQAVGSGTGAISAWEASMRLIGDGRYGDRLPTLELAQNEPFTPMAKAWNEGRRNLSVSDMGDPEDVFKTYSSVLTNRKPPYSMIGGVYDAMKACNGRFRKISNNEAISAEKLWMSFESVCPDPAASVAFASLIKATENGDIGSNDTILLNMTGGGLDRVKEEHCMSPLKIEARLSKEISDDDLRREIGV